MATNDFAPATTAHAAMARIDGSGWRLPCAARGSGTVAKAASSFRRGPRDVRELVFVELVNKGVAG